MNQEIVEIVDQIRSISLASPEDSPEELILLALLGRVIELKEKLEARAKEVSL